MDILGGGLVGRPAQEIGKLFDMADILVLSLGLSRRIVMSSISRRRNGLMALSVIGAPVLSEVLGPSISRQDACFCYSPRPSLATNYRGSGLVHRRILVVAERPGEGPFAMRFADLRHGGLGGAGSALASRLRAGWMEARVTPSSRAMDELLPWRV